MAKKIERLSLPVDDVLRMKARNGIACIDIESDGRVIRLKLSPETLVKGVSYARRLLAEGEILGLPRAQHS